MSDRWESFERVPYPLHYTDYDRNPLGRYGAPEVVAEAVKKTAVRLWQN